jgi:hypothetical protein
LGPAMDAARSPESRVKVKLMTRTVRHTKAASNRLRIRYKCIGDNYDGEAGTCKVGTRELIGNGIGVACALLHMRR